MTTPEVVADEVLPHPTPTRLPAILRRDRVVVGALVLLAVVLRAPNLGRSYWIDEGISVGIASRPLQQIPSLLRRDGSPPLFYVILHFWIRMFGSSEPATHLLPLLLSLIAIPAAYWGGKELFDRRAGVAAAALMTVNPFLGWYSTETRMYTMVVVLATLGVTFACCAFRDRRPGYAAAAVGSFAALLYTHNWGIYLTGGVAVVLLWLAWSRRDRTLMAWVIGGGTGALLLWAPWIPSFLFQAGNTAAPWAVRPAIGDFFADPSSALAGTLGFLIVPILVIGAWACRNLMPPGERRTAAWVALTALAASVAGFLGAQINPSWTVRYLGVLVGPYLLAAGGALASSGRGRAVLWTVCTLLVAWAVIGLLLPNPNRQYAKDNMAAVAGASSPYLRPGDVVVVTQTEQVPVAFHYLPRGLTYMTPTGLVSDPGVVDWRNIVHRLERATPCQALSPILDAIPVGTNVLEMDPVRRLGASGSAWSRAVNAQVSEVGAFLANDRALRQIDVFTPALRPKPYAAVDGILYQKTSHTPACA